MELKTLIDGINVEFLIFIITSLFAFISWIIKGLVEKPLSDSKETFSKFMGPRIEFLSEIKVRLSLIAYFHDSIEESSKFKEQIQELFLKDGKAIFLDKDVFDNVLKISITPETDHDLLLKTLTLINEDLTKQISKVQDEVKFYRKYSNYNPLKRFLGLISLALNYVFAIGIVFTVLGLFFYAIFNMDWCLVLLLLLFLGILIAIIDKWLNK